MYLPSKFTALVYCIVLMALAGAGTTLLGQSAGFAYVANQNCNRNLQPIQSTAFNLSLDE
jgi:hypothetical protein